MPVATGPATPNAIPAGDQPDVEVSRGTSDLRDLVRDLDRALAHALDLAHDLKLPRRAPAITARIGLLSRALSDARSIVDEIERAHDMEWAGRWDHGYARDVALRLTVALSQLRVFMLMEGNATWPSLPQRTRSWIQQAYSIVRLLYSNDLRGQDLSELDLSVLDLTGLVWSDTTIWPAGQRREIRFRSQDLRPGVYRVVDSGRPGSVREPSRP